MNHLIDNTTSDYRNKTGLGIGWDETCKGCGKPFRAFSHKQNVCSVECRFDFYSNQQNGCWEWSGPLNNSGYGIVFQDYNRNGRRAQMTAHRFSYQKHIGTIPDGLCVMHTCDNRKCVNPDHLKVGTWADNNRDRSLKGRSGSRTYTDEQRKQYSERYAGEKSPHSKLTADDVRFIRACTTMGCMKLAAKFSVSSSTIKHIRNGKSWKSVPD